jgi:plastocyanin
VGAKLLVAAGVAGLLVGFGAAGGSRAAAGQLVGDVGLGDSFQISVKDSSGAVVRHLDPGTYTLVVHDHSSQHNFDLSGPGVSVLTDIPGTGDSTYTITLTDGLYFYVCDAHAGQMKGEFAVGTATLPTTTTTAPSPPPAAATALTAGISASGRVDLRPTGGLSAGRFKLTITDRSRTDGFRLSGPGFSKSTGAAFTGKVTWTLALKAGTYTFSSVRHPKAKHALRISA